MEREDTIYYAKLIMLFLVIISLGMMAAYFTTGYLKNMQEFKDPCEKCVAKNPFLNVCFANAAQTKSQQYLNISTLAKFNTSSALN